MENVMAHAVGEERKTGFPLAIFLKQGGKYRLQEDNLKKILLRDDVQNHPVMIFSIAGAKREGKSFILNFIIRYLRSSKINELTDFRHDQWLGDQTSSLDGFTWKGGLDPNTMGILMWSEPFHINTTNGKVVVLLMDTPGLFDDIASMNDMKTIFCISFLLSSFQVYNVMKQIKDDTMQCFATFLEYAKMAKGPGEHRFLLQKLLFLIRDWPNEASHEYGKQGGQKYIDEYLTSTEAFSPKAARSNLKNVAEKIICFLMPNPGQKVRETRRNQKPFVGALKDIDEKFVAKLPELMETFFSLKNATPKSLNGQILTGKDVLAYAQNLDEIFSGNDLPKAEDILTTIKLAFYGALKEEFLKTFRGELDKILESEKINEEEFHKASNKSLSKLMMEYESRPKYETEDDDQSRNEISRILQNELEVYLQKLRNKREILRNQCCILANKRCKFYEGQLQEIFENGCCMPTLLEKTCADAGMEALTKLPSLVCNSKLNTYFNQLVTKEMKRVEERLMSRNNAVLRYLFATCKELKTRCKRFAEDKMAEALQEKTWSSIEIPRCKEKITKATSQHWDTISQSLNGPEEILNEHKRSLLDSTMEILSRFEEKNQSNRERLDKQVSTEAGLMLEEYKFLMAKMLGQSSHEPENIEKSSRKSCVTVANSQRVQCLEPYVKKKALELWELKVRTEFEMIRTKNFEAARVEKQRCDAVKTSCMKQAEILLEEVRGRKYLDDQELRDCLIRIKERVVRKFYADCPTSITSVTAKPRKDFEQYLEKEFTKRAVQKNARNKIFLEEEVEAVTHDMEIKCGLLFADLLDGREQDCYKMKMVENVIKRNLHDIINEKCTNRTSKNLCQRKVEELLEDDIAKYKTKRNLAEKHRIEALTNLKVKCLSTYRRRMHQLMTTGKVGNCHTRVWREIENMLHRHPDSLSDEVCKEVYRDVSQAKEEYLRIEHHREVNIENTEGRMRTLFKTTMENKLRGCCCSDSILQEYMSEAFESVQELRMRLKVELHKTTHQILEEEIEEILQWNDSQNVQDRLASDALAREEEIERRLSSFNDGLKGNSETKEEYRRHLKDYLTKISSNRETQLEYDPKRVAEQNLEMTHMGLGVMINRQDQTLPWSDSAKFGNPSYMPSEAGDATMKATTAFLSKLDSDEDEFGLEERFREESSVEDTVNVVVNDLLTRFEKIYDQLVVSSPQIEFSSEEEYVSRMDNAFDLLSNQTSTKTKNIPSDGGSIKHRGCELKIPPSAVHKDTDVEILVRDNPKNIPKYAVVISPILECKPTKFNVPVLVKLPTWFRTNYGKRVRVVILSKSNSEAEWKAVKEVILGDSNVITYEASHFCGQVATIAKEDEENGKICILSDVWMHIQTAWIIVIFCKGKHALEMAADFLKDDHKRVLSLYGELFVKVGNIFAVEVESHSPPGLKMTNHRNNLLKITEETLKKMYHKIYFFPDPHPEELRHAKRYEVFYRVKLVTADIELIEDMIDEPLHIIWPLVPEATEKATNATGVSCGDHANILFVGSNLDVDAGNQGASP